VKHAAVTQCVHNRLINSHCDLSLSPPQEPQSVSLHGELVEGFLPSPPHIEELREKTDGGSAVLMESVLCRVPAIAQEEMQSASLFVGASCPSHHAEHLTHTFSFSHHQLIRSVLLFIPTLQVGKLRHTCPSTHGRESECLDARREKTVSFSAPSNPSLCPFLSWVIENWC
jgi:hypothetical protein